MKTSYAKSWTISDDLWEHISPLIPKPQRDPNRKYKRQRGGGRKPADPRLMLEGIFYVLRTGIPWKAPRDQ
jgi:transposase